MANSAPTVRAETVGSLLQPEPLLAARQAVLSGVGDAGRLHALEDAAVDAAIALQESVGLDVITDGEMRRASWADTSRHLNGFEPREGERSYPSTAAGANRPGPDGKPILTVVGKISPKPEHPVGEEYPYLVARSATRTKYTMAAPSYHRRYWVDQQSTTAYDSCEDYLVAVRDWQHEVARWLVAQGCDYIQLDAPNYGSLCDPATRQFHEERGHDVDRQVAFDAALDSSLFEGLGDITRALHICRGNLPGGEWHSSGGYATLADQLFTNLDVDVVLLEYDSDRAGDFAPLAKIKPGTVAVLGLLTTKEGSLEDEYRVEARVAEAAQVKPLEELALSTQCGFASFANAPMSTDQQRYKLELVSRVAHRIWS